MAPKPNGVQSLIPSFAGRAPVTPAAPSMGGTSFGASQPGQPAHPFGQPGGASPAAGPDPAFNPYDGGGGATGLTSAGTKPSAAGPSSSGDPSQPSRRQQLKQQMTGATDPRERSVLRDQWAREIVTELKQFGHDVKWQGEQLIVDGRPYVLGDGRTPQPTPPAGSTTPPAGSTGQP